MTTRTMITTQTERTTRGGSRSGPALRTLLCQAGLLASAGALIAGCGSAPGDAVGESQAAVGGSNAEIAYDYFVNKGLTSYQAAGIVGNLEQESSVDPTVSQYGGGPGRGIAQWSAGGRWDTDGGDNAVWYAATQGQSVWTLDLQLEFIWYELTTFPSYGLGALRGSTDVASATVAFETDFEGCGECDQSNRIAFAESVLAAYGSTTPPPVSTPPSAPSLGPVRGVAADGTGNGYWIVADDGGVFSYGDANFFGSEGGHALNAPVVAMASSENGGGYLLAASDGGVFTFGNVGFHGSMGGQHLNQPIVGVALTPDEGGYWLVASDGGIFAFGNAGFYGSMGGQHLNEPVVGMAATPSGGGYWLVASDGGLFAFGDAGFYGSLGSDKLNKPVVGMASTPSGEGYWMVAADGGIFAFGNAGFYGSMGGKPLNQPVVGMSATPSGQGYWLVAADGGLFTFGNAPFHGSDAK
jgi:Phage tail lysozyme